MLIPIIKLIKMGRKIVNPNTQGYSNETFIAIGTVITKMDASTNKDKISLQKGRVII